MRAARTMIAIAIATVVGALALIPGATSAQSSGSSSGAPFDIRTVSTVVPLRTDNAGRALAVYKALIPNGLSMPAHPIVGVWLSELSAVRSNNARPMDPVDHWIEGAIEIRVHHGTEDGWYPILYPVTAEFWFQAGRAVGLPKRHASASITPDGHGFKAQATPSGESSPSIVMDWQPGPNTDPPANNLAFRDALDPLFVLNPALKGPQLERVQYVVSPPSPLPTLIPGGAPAYTGNPNGPVQAGAVAMHLVADTDAVQESDLPKIFPPGSSLADIVNPDQTVPGAYYFYAVNLNDTSAVIGSGGYGPRRPISTPPPKRPSSHRSKCMRSRAVVMHITRASLKTVRVYLDGRRVAARILSHGRVRFWLAAHDTHVQHARVVAETAGRRTLVRNASFRTCASRTKRATTG